MTYSEGAVFHGLFGIDGVASSDHFDKRMTFVLVDYTSLYLAMAVESTTQFTLGTTRYIN